MDSDPPRIEATIDIRSQTLNLVSKGKWIVVYIELPEPFNVSYIDVSTVMLSGAIPVDVRTPMEFGDYDNDTIPDLMLKFNRTLVIEHILGHAHSRNVTLVLSGSLHGFVTFEGVDTITVSVLIGDVNCDGKVDISDVVQALASYGSKEDEPEWTPNANFAPPWNLIDICDIVTIACHYGETYP